MRPPYTPRRNWPGYRTLLNEYAIFFPFSIRGISPGPIWQIYTKHAQFARHGWDAITGVRTFAAIRPLAVSHLRNVCCARGAS